MKTIRILGVAMALVLVAGAVSVKAQTLTTLYSFCKTTNNFFCSDGSDPGHLVLGNDGNFYGATTSGGSNDLGTIFKITPQGTLTTLHQFSGHLGVADGSFPLLSLESGGLFYGATTSGGTNNHGTIFTITSAGTLTTLHQFSGTNGVADGTGPEVLLPAGGSFIGNTALGGTNNAGTIFTITPGGVLTTIHQFSGTNGVADGSLPVVTLQNGANFIGTTLQGGSNNDGTAFQITAGGAFTTIHVFDDADGKEPIITAKNGANFIGTTALGGSNGVGSAFEMTSGGVVTTFYQFSGTNGVLDGSSPGLSPIQDNSGAFYGGTQDGGTNSAGLIFTLTTTGTLTPVYEFCSVGACLDGSSPGEFIQSGGNLFGTTDNGGANGGGGTIFKLVPGNGASGGCTFALNSTNQEFAASGGNGTVSVIASNGCDWTATNNDSFITITSGSSGSGNGTVHYTVAANSSTNPVTGTMTIAGETFTVTQAGAAGPGQCTFTLNATSVALAAKGGKKSVSVKAVGTDCAWTAVSNDGFITIASGSSGTGNGKVAFTIAGNTNTTALIGTMTIAGQTFTVNQAAGGCTFKLSPKSGKLKATGGAKTVKVSPNLSDCDWTAASNDGFITITGGASGTGKGTISYSVST
ncbi:MAG TPA: choice-of-anchor tandem repeat GloVer-containing protein, partial [Verrucomicrobiae bacterium]|nr:choice-of-anchor tandem repeat GloVer-containing protein [Verrucomicrobiae bacterium]